MAGLMSIVSVLCGLANAKVLIILFLVSAVFYLWQPAPNGFSKPLTLSMYMSIYNGYITFRWLLHALGISPMEKGLRPMARLQKAKIAPGLTSEDLTLDGVRVRLYKRKDSSTQELRPGMIYIHGGGWLMGSPSMWEPQCSSLLKRLDMVVISVDYRLAPEYKFPVPLEDCVAASKSFLSKAASFGVDGRNVAISGDSAGGNLAAAVCLRLRDDSFSPMPKHQLLIYPVLQAVDFSLPSIVQNAKGCILSCRLMTYMWSQYATGTDKYVAHMMRNTHTSPDVKRRLAASLIRHEDVSPKNRYRPYKKPSERSLARGDPRVWEQLKGVLENPYLAPLMAEDLTRLPDAFIYTAQYDMLRDEGELYAKRLARAGVNVVHFNGEKGFHGVLPLKRLFPEGQEGFEEYFKYIKNNMF